MKFSLNDNLSQAKWDDFVSANSQDGGFLQSFGWGDFQTKNGKRVWRLAVEADKKVIGAATVIKHRLPLGQSYLYCPRGPVIASSSPIILSEKKDLLDFLFSEIKKLAIKERALFFRFDPAWVDDKILLDNNFVRVGQVQPKQSLILDLSLSEERLLKNMKPKTRYNIKVAEKHGIKVEVSKNPIQDFEEFWRLMALTATRDRIRLHQRDYYLKMLKTAGVKLVLARGHNLASGRPVAGNIMAFFGEWCVYLHGASDHQFRDKMAPYLLQWQMIKEAKKSGCKYYDFWGADEKLWPGVTRFKVGFAPTTPMVEYVGAYDLPFNGLIYFFYKLARKIF